MMRGVKMRASRPVKPKPGPGPAEGKAGPPILERQLEELLWLTPLQLRGRWHALFAHRAPTSISAQKIARAIAFRLQANHYGVEDTLIPARRVSQVSALTDGVGAPIMLRRFWKGQDHEVMREGDAFLYRGKTYRSISAVARAITGTRWNGWSFFGLKSPAASPDEAAHG